ncbi:MAG: 16S rRNA (guanine(527)-N(7))-methyltransferase RsmG [Gammaproteobacteria bacterium]|nr:16S rRNA (guanine(527)-N(7))-methyltransferase RsmG [Gammaproteobacteria bacterium]
MQLLKQALDTNHITLTEQQIVKLAAYLDQLNRWNKTYNLTAITDPKEQVYKHIVDSLSIRDAIKGPKVCDVGTGPGLPGIPLAIALPDIHFTLVDSSQKRIIFLQQALIKLKITNVTALHQRIEENKDTFNTLISRAFSSIQDFVEKTRHVLANNGQLLAMKGAYPTEELTQIPQDFIVEDVRKLTIHGLDAERHLVILKTRNRINIALNPKFNENSKTASEIS